MEPVGSFLRAVLPHGRRTAGLRPGSIVQATVERSLARGHWLLQVGGRHFTARSHLNLTPGESLRVQVEQSTQGVVLRVLEPARGHDALLSGILAEMGVTENLREYASVLEGFMQVGLPLTEQYTLHAIRQFGRLFQEHPIVRRRFREAGRFIAMFADRGLRVPDDVIIDLLASPHRHPGHGSHRFGQQKKEHPRQETAEDGEAERDTVSETDAGQPVLMLPSSESYSPTETSWISSLKGREHPWIIVPLRYGMPELEDTVEGDLRIQLVFNEPSRAVLDVRTTNSRWIFSWSIQHPGILQVYTDTRSIPQEVIQQLTACIDSIDHIEDYRFCPLENWDGFTDQDRGQAGGRVDEKG